MSRILPTVLSFCSVLSSVSLSVLSVSAFALSNEEGQKLAEASLKDLVVASAKHYCVAGTMTCRSFLTLKHKTTGQMSPVFRITFFSSERQVAGTEIYVPVSSGSDQYHRLVDTTFDGAITISRADEIQKVEKSGSDIRIKELYMPKLGTTQFIVSDLLFSENIAQLEGLMKDSKDPSFSQAVKIDYIKVNTEEAQSK
jgi:hypothetical protein